MMMADHLSPMKSGSLAASRWRQELAARSGNGMNILEFSRSRAIALSKFNDRPALDQRRQSG